VEVINEAEDRPLELRVEADGAGFRVWGGDTLLCEVRGREDRRAFAVNVRVEGWCDRRVAAQILGAVEAAAAAGAAGFDAPTRGPGPQVDSLNPVIRDEARRRGYTGPLRGPLTMPSLGQSGRCGSEGRTAGPAATAVGQCLPGGATDRAATAARLGELLGRSVSAAAGGSRWLNALRFGYAGAARLTVAGSDLAVTIPDTPELMVETVARAIDTVLDVRHRFGVHADHLRSVSFDRPSHGAQRARWAGQASPTVFSIHLNEDLAVADGWVRLRREREAAPLRRPSAGAPPPSTLIDGVAAHEAWHQIEFKFRARIADHSAFRRALGAVLGVETLEQAIQGGHRNAAGPMRSAYERLRDTVSPYATTNPLEATAEMFKLWWCGASNPTLDCFGTLLDRYFDLGRTGGQ